MEPILKFFGYVEPISKDLSGARSVCCAGNRQAQGPRLKKRFVTGVATQCLLLLLAVPMPVGAASAEPAIIPRPQSIVVDPDGVPFRCDSGSITADGSAAATAVAELLRSELPRSPGAVRFAADPALAPEAYRLTVNSGTVRIEASDYAGFFNGSRTLLQLLRQSPEGELAPMTIEDAPRFRWRGLMLDVARHYFPPEFLYKLVDRLAEVKMNVLHLHLTDDQGWRIEIKRYPLLTAKGAWRDGVGFQLDPASTVHYREDGRYGGFYTQDELRKLVAYAAARNVTIVPEITIPGHSHVAVANYPELLKCEMSGGSNVYCAGQESSYRFIENVLLEVFEIFPSPYIVLGSDEVRGRSWDACPRCRKLAADNGFKSRNELQRHFVSRIADFCRGQNRKPTGWDEIVSDGGDAMSDVAVMSRSDRDLPGVSPAEAGREMIIMKSAKCYFDCAQDIGEPRATSIRNTWENTYRLEPFPPTLAPEKQRFVLGVEGALWTEFVPNEGHAAYLLFPRALALAEVAWTRRELLDEINFRIRLRAYLPALDEAGICYRPDGGLLRVTERDGKVEITTPIPDAAIYYTLDDSYPTATSQRYTEPLAISDLSNLRIAVIGRRGNAFPVFDRTVGAGKWTISGPEAAEKRPLELAFDDDINSYYLSKKPFVKGSEIRLDFAAPRQLDGIRVVSARMEGGGGNSLASGRLQISADGEIFTDAAQFNNGIADFKCDPQPVRAIRIVADATVKPALRIREIALSSPPPAVPVAPAPAVATEPASAPAPAVATEPASAPAPAVATTPSPAGASSELAAAKTSPEPTR